MGNLLILDKSRNSYIINNIVNSHVLRRDIFYKPGGSKGLAMKKDNLLVAGLWIKGKSNGKFALQGKLSDSTGIWIEPNLHKKAPKHPDYNLYFTKFFQAGK